MKFSSEYVLAVLIFVYNMITISTHAAAISKADTFLQVHSDALCPSQLCSSSPAEFNTTRFCNCDPDCEIFQDCCYDYSIKRNGIQHDRLRRASRNVEIKCTYVPSLGWNLLVSSCASETMHSPNVTHMNRHLCNSRSEVQPHMLDIPVTSATTGLTYRNVHCAVCNEDADNLLPRKAILKSSVLGSSGEHLERAIYEDDNLSWQQNADYSSLDLPANTLPEEGSGGRGDFTMDDLVTGVLREFFSSLNGNFSDEDDMMINIPDQSMKELRDHGGNILERISNFSKASPLKWISRFKANSGSQKHQWTHKDLLNMEELSKQEWLPNTPGGYMGSDGEFIEWMESQGNMSIPVGTKYRLFLDGEYLRPCKRYLDSCDPNWEKGKSDVSELCLSYSMPVYTYDIGKGIRVLKNPHCALCNHISVSELNCCNPEQFRLVDNIFSKLTLPKINFIFGNVLRGHKKCGVRSVWDPLFNQCYYLDVIQEVSKFNSASGPISVATTEAVVNLKMNDLSEDEYISAEDDECKDYTLMTMTKVQWYLTSAFFGVSIICLGLHVITYAYPRKSIESFSRETMNQHHFSQSSLECEQITGYSFIVLCWLLFIGQLLFAVGIRRSEIRAVCLSIAILHNFFSLAAISWLSIFCLQVFKSHFSIQSLKSMGSPKSGMEAPPLKLSLIAWIIPTIFSILCLTLELVPGSLRPCLARGGACWYGETISFRLFFVLPALLMLAGDGCIFTAIIFGVHDKKEQNVSTSVRRKNNSHLRRSSGKITNHDHRCFRLCARLGFIMTISWSCAVAASLGNIPSLWYGFVIFSGIQGIYIFVSSGAKTRLTNFIWTKHSGQSEQVRRERSIKNHFKTVGNT